MTAPASTENVETPPAKPEAPKAETTKPEAKTYTQAELEEIVKERLESTREQKKQEKLADQTVQQQIAALEETIKAAEERALNATIASLAGDFHPGVEKFLTLDGLTSADTDKIQAQLAALRTERPYLVNTAATGTPAPNLTPAPGVTTGEGSRLLSAADLQAITPEELAADPAKMKLYTESLDALRKVG